MQRAFGMVAVAVALAGCGGDDTTDGADDPCRLVTEVPDGLGRSAIGVGDGWGAIANGVGGTQYLHVDFEGQTSFTPMVGLSTSEAPSQLVWDGTHVVTLALDSPRLEFFGRDGSAPTEGPSLGLDPGLPTGGPPTLMVLAKIATGFAVAHVSPQASGWRTNYVEADPTGAPLGAPVAPPGTLAVPRMMASMRGHAAFAYRYEGTPGQTVVSLTMDPWPMGLSYVTESADGAAGIASSPDDSTVLVAFNDTLYRWNAAQILPVEVTGRPVSVVRTPTGYAVAVIVDTTLRVVILDDLFAFHSVTDVAFEDAYYRVALAAADNRILVTYGTAESPTSKTTLHQVCPE